jgi:hypothetical protein
MLNAGKKIHALHDKFFFILTLVLSKKKFLNETKNHNHPPLQVKWSVPNEDLLNIKHKGDPMSPTLRYVRYN